MYSFSFLGYPSRDGQVPNCFKKILKFLFIYLKEEIKSLLRFATKTIYKITIDKTGGSDKILVAIMVIVIKKIVH